MQIVSGPVGTLLVALLALVALALWLRRDRRYPGPRRESGEDAIDRAELEAAEREVRELGSQARPDEGFEGDDWGPGASRPRQPGA
ncbi:MAG: hypothetical protein ACREMZ_07350 [Gemmatimonadales bacterium]